jgi:hypothetical protein
MTRPAEKPLFHVSLGDLDEWVIEAEWPDGTLPRACRCSDFAALDALEPWRPLAPMEKPEAQRSVGVGSLQLTHRVKIA